uniref:Uncharacterized protein n=1 Tax=Glossina pallidipes TaxID=7398 RepID=A0A1A9ZC89_GLOPL
MPAPRMHNGLLPYESNPRLLICFLRDSKVVQIDIITNIKKQDPSNYFFHKMIQDFHGSVAVKLTFICKNDNFGCFGFGLVGLAWWSAVTAVLYNAVYHITKLVPKWHQLRLNEESNDHAPIS